MTSPSCVVQEGVEDGSFVCGVGPSLDLVSRPKQNILSSSRTLWKTWIRRRCSFQMLYTSGLQRVFPGPEASAGGRNLLEIQACPCRGLSIRKPGLGCMLARSQMIPDAQPGRRVCCDHCLHLRPSGNHAQFRSEHLSRWAGSSGTRLPAASAVEDLRFRAGSFVELVCCMCQTDGK